MRGRRLLGSALAGLLAVAGGACGKQKLTTVEVPDAGVALRYDLAPGRAYDGHFKVRTSLLTPVGEMVTRLEYDVGLVVLQPQDNAMLVQATVANVALDLRLPDGMPAAMLDKQGFNAATAATLNDMELGFVLSERGDVTELADPPTEGALGQQAMIGMVLAGIRTAIVRVPESSVVKGETWDAVDPATLRDDESVEGTGKLEGLGQDQDGRNLAQLTFTYKQVGTRSTPVGAVAFVTAGTIAARFAVAEGYPTHVEATLSQEAGGQTSALEIESDWTQHR